MSRRKPYKVVSIVQRHVFLLKLILDRNLTDSARRVGAVLVKFIDDADGTTWIARDKLAKYAHCHPNTTIDAVDLLTERGYVDVVEFGGREGGVKEANVYRCRHEAIPMNEEANFAHGREELARVKAERAKRAGGHQLHEKVRAELAAARRAARARGEKV